MLRYLFLQGTRALVVGFIFYDDYSSVLWRDASFVSFELGFDG